MATNHTEHYNLNLWEPSDKFVRAEFNENSQKIDAALAGKTDAEVSAALQNRVTALEAGRAQIVTGSYVGSGQYGPDHPNTLNFAGALDRSVKLVIIRPQNAAGTAQIFIRGMTDTMGAIGSTYYTEKNNKVSWTDYSVSWWNGQNSTNQTNYEGLAYLYIAIA